MAGVNLIPMQRRVARRRQARLRKWTGACAAYAVVLLVGYGACRGVWITGGDLAAELDEVAQQIDQSNASITALGADMAQARLMLDASRRVAEQPDWSVLLALLPETLGDEIVLKRCQLQRLTEYARAASRTDETGTPARPQNGMPSGFTAVLQGYGRTPESVSRFVLRLEGTGLFSRVNVRRTNREVFLGSDAIAFSVECALEQKRERPR